MVRPGYLLSFAILFASLTGMAAVSVEAAADRSTPGRHVPGLLHARRPALDLDEARIRSFAEALLGERGVPGLSLGIVRGRDLVYARSFGVADRRSQKPATPDTLYAIGGVTQTMTATLLMTLRDRGVLRLDDLVTDYLPRGVGLPAAASGGARGITLQQLATHTSGLPAEAPNLEYLGRSPRPYGVADLYAGLAASPRNASVGDARVESDLGYMLLGHALANATGRTYEGALVDELLRPLGMRDTRVSLAPEQRSRLATSYWPDDPEQPRRAGEPGPVAGHAGVVSSVRDLARFVALQLRSDEVSAGRLSGASLREMQRAQRFRAGPEQAAGMAWLVDHFSEAGRVVYRVGTTGGSSAYVALSPALDVGVIVLANFGPESVEQAGAWLMHEAVRGARARTVPSRRRALDFAREGDWSNAAWAFGQRVASGPSDGEAHFHLGRAQWNLQRLGDAARSWLRAAELNHEPATALHGAARALAALEREAEAIGVLASAVEAGFDDLRQLQSDSGLDRLRGSADFAAVVARVESARGDLPLSDEQIALYSGTYEMDGGRGRIRVFGEHGRLMSLRQGEEQSGPRRLRHLGDHRFRDDALQLVFEVAPGGVLGIALRDGVRTAVGERVAESATLNRR